MTNHDHMHDHDHMHNHDHNNMTNHDHMHDHDHNMDHKHDHKMDPKHDHKMDHKHDHDHNMDQEHDHQMNPKNHKMDQNDENEVEVTTKRNKTKPKKKGRTGRRFGRNRLETLPFNFRIPKTGFSCKGRAPGYYADMEADCSVKNFI